MRLLIFLYIISFTTLFSQSTSCKKIIVADGPEDFVFDTLANDPRLIIACQNRRTKGAEGDFYALNLTNDSVKKLIRKNEPDSFFLWAHGIDIEIKGSEKYLYAITHQPKEMVAKYKITDDTLYFIKLFKNKLLEKINDISVYKGGFLVSNYMTIKGNIAYIDSSDQGEILISNIKFPNGVCALNDSLFFYSSSIENSLVKCEMNKQGVFSEQKILRVKGPDNIIANNQYLFVTGHNNLWKLRNHAKHGKKKSPCTIFRVNLDNGKSEKIFYSNGELISAASSAAIYKGKLFVSQIFENYLLVK